MLFYITLVVVSLQLALAYPSNMSTSIIIKRDNPTFSDLFASPFSEVEQAQLKQGFADACNMAKAAQAFALPGNPVYAKYFNTDADTLNNVQQVFAGIVGGPALLEDTCSAELSRIALSKDFINADENNELSCTQDQDMASTRFGSNPDANPIMVICPTLLAHGNIGPTVIPEAPAPVTCDTVQEVGRRTTWRMNTVGSTILHEYTHVAFLVEKALPQGTKDSLDFNDDPSFDPDEEIFYYGPVLIQGDLRFRRGGIKSAEIADAYTWFANEAFWSQKCGVNYALAQENDDEDPKYGNLPGEDRDSNAVGASVL